MDKIVVNKATKRHILAHLILYGLLSISCMVRAATPAPLLPSMQCPIPHKVGFQQKRSTQPYIAQWFDAAKAGNAPLLVELYKNHDIDVNIGNDNAYTALHLTAYKGYLDCLKLLTQQGAHIHATEKKGYTALLLSAYKGHLHCLKYLLQQGADIHATDKEGYTALLLSAYKGHINCLQLLTQQGADINAANKWGNTALIWSAQNGHLDCVKHLLQQSADITWKGADNKTALEWAKEKGQENVVNYLSTLAVQSQAATQHNKDDDEEYCIVYINKT